MRRERWRSGLRWLLAISYLAAGVLHLSIARPFIEITPDWVPMKPAVIALTGMAEIAGAIALAQPWSMHLRRAGGIGMALYAVCVFPANINMALNPERFKQFPAWGLWARLPLQFAIIGQVWAATQRGKKPAAAGE